MTTTKITSLRGDTRQEAASLITELLPGTHLSLEEEQRDLNAVDAALASTPFQAPQPIWIGIRDETCQLVAALHASACLAQAADVHRQQPNPGWVAIYVTQNLIIEEVAVRPSHRRQGLARALLRRAHNRARAATLHPDEFNVTSFATSAEAQALFRSEGYDLGERRQPVPPDFASNLNSLWDPSLNAVYPEARWAWARLNNLARG